MAVAFAFEFRYLADSRLVSCTAEREIFAAESDFLQWGLESSLES